MKKWLICITAIFFFIFTPNAAAADTLPQPVSPQGLCLPGVYLDVEVSCAVLGPSAYFTERAQINAEIASQDRRFIHVDETLGTSQYQYLQVHEEKVKLYYTLEDAAEKTNPANELPEGYTFISYTNVVPYQGKNYYQLPDGRWLRNGSVAAMAAPNRFLGVLPVTEPTRYFGWVLADIETQEEPGYGARQTGNTFKRYQFIEVFDSVKIGESYFYMIAPDEWVHMTLLALIYPAEAPPEGIWVDRWIEINLHEQTISAYDDGRMVFATLTTTGSNRNFTRPGVFQIYKKLPITNMAGSSGEDDAYYLMDIPWTMYFDESRAFHAQYWHDHLGYKSSHGCVNLSFPDANWLFDWAADGEWVYVWDPSGRTPTDPDLFETGDS
jgi:hypothetical protein